MLVAPLPLEVINVFTYRILYILFMIVICLSRKGGRQREGGRDREREKERKRERERERERDYIH